MPLPREERYTFADSLTWDESERMELIEGIPMMMSPPTRIHQEISGELYRQIANYLEGKKCKVYSAPFAVRLFEKATDRPDQVDTMVEPDISVICDFKKLDKYGCKGSPDLIIEVLSLSTQRHDRMVKYNLYQRAGVREYWMVEPEYQTIQVCLLEDGVYRVHEIYSARDIAKINVLDGCFIELSKVFA